MKSHWITHRGKRIFLVDYSDFGSNTALTEEANGIIEAVTRELPNSVLALSDVRGTTGTLDTLAIMKRVVTSTNRHVRRRAVVGVSGLRESLLDMVNRVTGNKPFAVFQDMEAAKEWLVKE
jgi:hypothetical protein